MEQHDHDALKGLIWLAMVWWWAWGHAWFYREAPRPKVDSDERKDDPLDPRPPRARYSCAPTRDDRLLIGIRVDPPQAAEEPGHSSSAEDQDGSRTPAEEAIARANATPHSWAGYFMAMRVWFRFANEVAPDSR